MFIYTYICREGLDSERGGLIELECDGDQRLANFLGKRLGGGATRTHDGALPVPFTRDGALPLNLPAEPLCVQVAISFTYLLVQVSELKLFKHVFRVTSEECGAGRYVTGESVEAYGIRHATHCNSHFVTQLTATAISSRNSLQQPFHIRHVTSHVNALQLMIYVTCECVMFRVNTL